MQMLATIPQFLRTIWNKGVDFSWRLVRYICKYWLRRSIRLNNFNDRFVHRKEGGCVLPALRISKGCKTVYEFLDRKLVEFIL